MFQWSWLAGFVEPNSGDTYWWIVPRVNWQIFERMLVDFAAHFELGEHKRVLLVIDKATFHTTAQITLPEGLDLLFLPPKSPELQPAERLWLMTNEAIANKSFESLDAVEESPNRSSLSGFHISYQRQRLYQVFRNFHFNF